MRERLKTRLHEALHGDEDVGADGLTTLRAAAAQLLLATSAEVALEWFWGHREDDAPESANSIIALAPLLIAPLTAAAHLEHSRNPRENTALALNILNATSVVVGGAMTFLGLFDSPRSGPRVAPLTLASAGLIGLALDAEERMLEHERRELRRRAHMVERLVPKRKPRLDRVVVHV